MPVVVASVASLVDSALLEELRVPPERLRSEAGADADVPWYRVFVQPYSTNVFLGADLGECRRPPPPFPPFLPFRVRACVPRGFRPPHCAGMTLLFDEALVVTGSNATALQAAVARLAEPEALASGVPKGFSEFRALE